MYITVVATDQMICIASREATGGIEVSSGAEFGIDVGINLVGGWGFLGHIVDVVFVCARFDDDDRGRGRGRRLNFCNKWPIAVATALGVCLPNKAGYSGQVTFSDGTFVSRNSGATK